MRTPAEIRETAFIVARKNRADGLDDVRPMPAAAQLHFDVLDLLNHAEADLERLEEKDAEIEKLRKVLGDIVYEEEYSRPGYEKKSAAQQLAEGALR